MLSGASKLFKKQSLHLPTNHRLLEQRARQHLRQSFISQERKMNAREGNDFPKAILQVGGRAKTRIKVTRNPVYYFSVELSKYKFNNNKQIRNGTYVLRSGVKNFCALFHIRRPLMVYNGSCSRQRSNLVKTRGPLGSECLGSNSSSSVYSLLTLSDLSMPSCSPW